MPITFVCPSGHSLRAAKNQAGRQVSCPVCGQRTLVPSPDNGETLAGASSRAGRGRPPQPPPLPVQDHGDRQPQPPLVAQASQDANGHQPLPPSPRNQQQAQSLPSRRGIPTLWQHWLPQPHERLVSEACRPDRGKVQTVRWLAVLLGFLVLFSAVPALEHPDLQISPGWSRAVLLVAGLQAIYVVWMALTPDWSTVRVVMMVFAAVSALYGMATAIAIVTPLDSPLPLGMQEVRTSAARWCGAILLLMSLATYLCGRVSFQWQRSRRTTARESRGDGELGYRGTG